MTNSPMMGVLTPAHPSGKGGCWAWACSLGVFRHGEPTLHRGRVRARSCQGSHAGPHSLAQTATSHTLNVLLLCRESLFSFVYVTQSYR